MVAAVKYQLAMRPEAAVVALEGSLTEGIEQTLMTLRAQLGARAVVFDFARLRHVNSRGLALWAAFIDGLAEPPLIEFVNCPATFVINACVTAKMLGRGEVKTFYAGFRCDGCGAEQQLLFHAESVRGRSYGEVACARCAGAMTPDVEPETYLAFLSEPVAD